MLLLARSVLCPDLLAIDALNAQTLVVVSSKQVSIITDYRMIVFATVRNTCLDTRGLLGKD